MSCCFSFLFQYQVRVNCNEGSGTWVLVGKVFTRKKNTSQTTYGMVSVSNRRFSNPSRLEAVAESQVVKAQPRRRSSLKIAPLREGLEEHQSKLSRLDSVVAFIVFLTIVSSFLIRLHKSMSG
jgi:hypothetical protein